MLLKWWEVIRGVSFRVRKKALVQMGSWQKMEERFWVHGSGRFLCPRNSLLQKYEERESIKPNQEKKTFQAEKLG